MDKSSIEKIVNKYKTEQLDFRIKTIKTLEDELMAKIDELHKEQDFENRFRLEQDIDRLSVIYASYKAY